MYDLIVIGAGAAGVSAALYAKSRGLNLLLIEKKEVGGIIGNVSTVTHFSGIIEHETGTSFKNRLKAQAISSGITILYENVVDVNLDAPVKTVVTDKGCYMTNAVIFANGSTPRALNIPGEAEFNGKGIGLNALRDGQNYKDKNVYVVGGADGAIKEAIYLSSICKHVTIIHFEDKLGCIAEFKNKIKDIDNISLLLNSRLVKVAGDTAVDKLYIQNELTHEVNEITDNGCGIFVYAGLLPNTSLAKGVELEGGYIKVNSKMETSIKGVYAAGDIISKQVRQVATAISDGAIAGINASTYVSNLK